MEVFLRHITEECSDKKLFILITTICFVALTIYYSTTKIPKCFRKSSNTSLIPYLPSIPILGAFYPLIWQNANQLFLSRLSTYGSTFRTNIMGTEVVLLSNPKWIQKLLTSSEPGHMSKFPLIYNLVFPSILKEGLVSQSKVSIWKHHRSISAKAFSLESLKAYLRVLNRHAKQLIDKMGAIIIEDDFEKAIGSNTLYAKLREYTYHSTGELFGGLETLSMEEQHELEEKFVRCQNIMAYRMYHPWCLSETIWKFFPERKEMNMHEKSIVKTFENTVRNARLKLTTKTSMKTLIDYMIEGGLNNEEIVCELGNFAIPAYDTLSTGLNYILFLLALLPNYQAECRKEIDEIFESQSKNRDVVDEELSWDDLAQMKYLEMCIKEGLRMFSPIPAFVRELKTSIELEENLVLDKGTVIFVSPALIHRDPQVYPDPTIYNPDRFLPENCKARNVYSYIPYSKGIRDCIGQRLATMHLKITVAYILRTYELYPGSPDDNIEKVWDTAVWPIKDLGVRWRKRE